MAKGTVRWFNSAQGFGFIIPDDGGKDLYVQSTNIETPEKTLIDHQRVVYETSFGRKGPEAVHVRNLD